MIFHFISCLVLSLTQCCPFSQYEEGLIQKDLNFYSITHFIPPLRDEDSFSFGYWIFYHSSMKYKEDTYNYQLLAILNQESYIIFRIGQSVMKQEKSYEISMSLSDMKLNSIFKFPYYKYSGCWLFNMITFQNSIQTIIIEITGQEQKKIMLDVPLLQQSQTYTFQIGDNDVNQFYKWVGIPQQEGRLSKIIFFDEYIYQADSFENFQLKCSIPPNLVGEQSVALISDISNFYGDQFLQTSLTQYGRKYLITGWAKYLTQNIELQIFQILLRISSNKYSNTDKIFGDNLFKLESFIYKQYPVKSKLSVTIDIFCIPETNINFCQIQSDQYTSNFYFEFQDQNDLSFYEGLQQWHYFQYEYGRDINDKLELLFQIQFLNSIGQLQKSISDEIYKTSWTNDLFYIFIGEKNNQYDYLQASIFDLKFIHNYDQNKEFQLICHNTCKTCKGPFANDCLSCYDLQYRTFIQELNQCVCKDGFYELEIENPDCSTVNNFFITVSISQIIIEKQNLCQQGYFQIIQQDQTVKCIQCPQQQPNSYFCYDCLVGSNTWSLNLVCSKDLISRGINDEDGYFLQDRSNQTIDIYFLDQQYNLIYLSGYQGYCNLNLNQDNCFLIQAIKNIKKIDQGGFCKPNYFYYQGECLIRDYKCLQFNVEGDCVECQDNQYLRNKRCFNCPIKCQNCLYDENQQELQCQKCLSKYGILNGVCQKCGQYCLICEQDSSDIYQDNNILNIRYLKCFKCIDDSEYFISIDHINCKKNEITDCKYVMQVTQYQFDFSYFKSDSIDSNIMTVCTICKASPIYDIEIKQCINNPDIVNNNEQIMNNGYYFMINGYSKQCIISNSNFYAPTYTENCNTYVNNCAICSTADFNLQDPSNSQTACILCKQGYYAARLSGQCLICPQNMNCLSCGQQQRKSKDYWIYEIKPFIKALIENYDLFYIYNMQSQEISDYEIICKLCKEGFSVVDGLCIPECPKSCLECELLNMEFKCVRCPKIENKIQLSIIDNQCIQCPNKCTLCRIRNENEIFAINPQFTDQDYILNSYQCLQSIENQKLFYDNEIGRFIQCEQDQLCINEITITLNLICSETEYQAQLNKLIDNSKKKEFQQSNIQITDLFSTTSSFQQFQNHIFYQYANQDAIKTIKIIIESSSQQICQIGPSTKLDQSFAEHIFSLKYVELELNFEQLVEFQLKGEIQILNFHKIVFKNVFFTSIKSNFYKFIKFQSIYQQQIQLYDFTLDQQKQQLNNQFDTMIIEISNISKLEIFGFQIQNLILNNQNNFFTVSQQSFLKSIILKDIQIKNCIINNQNQFNFYFGTFDTFQLDNLSVVSTFNNSKLMKINKYDYFNQNNLEIQEIQISNIMLKFKIYNSLSLFELISNQKVKVSNFSILNSKIINSTIMNLNNEISINNFMLLFSELNLNSIILFNVEQSENVTLKIINLNFENNQYDSTIHFIYFRKLNTKELLIDIKNLTLINNIGTYILVSAQDFEKSLINIEANQILIQDFQLLKGYGMSEIFIKEPDNFTLLNSEITQDEQFKFLGLHQHLDCVLNTLDKITYVQAISIYSSKIVYINNMRISNLQLINFPIIHYKSVEVEINKQIELFQMENIIINNNFLLQTDSISTTSIILISTQQIMQIQLNNMYFENNLFHSYQQNYQKQSSTLINIDSFQSQFLLNQSIVQNNFVTNSTDSIMYINCQSIIINLCNFQFNSQFNYQTLQPYIIWGFSDENVYFEQIESIFPIISETGNGLLVGQNVSISNTKIQESQGQQGGAFKIKGQNNCLIKFSNIILNKISTIFSHQIELGGAFNIDGSQTQRMIIQFDQILGENLYCKNFGGFVYLKFGNQFFEILISNLYMKDIQSEIGSLVYLDLFSMANNQQSLLMYNVTIKNSKESFERYLSYFKIFLQGDINQIEKNRTLVYSNFGTNLSFNHINIMELYEEGLFEINSIQSIVIQNVKIVNCIFKGQLIKIQPFENLQQFITIKELFIKNVSLLTYQYDYVCLQKLKQIPQIQQKCNNIRQTSPKNLQQYLLNLYIEDQLKVCFEGQSSNDLQVLNSGLIVINGLNDNSKINLAKIFLEQIDCTNCDEGLIYHQFQSKNEQPLQTTFFYEQISITNSICGYQGCLNLQKYTTSNSLLRRMYSFNNQNLIWQSEIFIHNFVCQNNTALYGTCLKINNLICTVSSSLFISNKAKQYGGAIYIEGNQLFVINNTQILNNTAITGGGLYFIEQHQINYKNFQNTIYNNLATFQGNDYKMKPEGLFLYIQSNIPLNNEIIIQNSNLTIVQAGGQLKQNIKLPSGQQLSKFKQFDHSNRKYINSDYSFRIRAVQFDDSQVKQLDNSFCTIQSRQINNETSENSSEFTNNFTNIEQVVFDSIKQEYQFDDLIIYFDSNISDNIYLQLDFQCNSVIVPVYDNLFPYQLISHHQNYHLRVNIKTLPCQYGEIKNLTDLSCHLCDAEQGFFSLKLNQPKCELKDEISTLNVKSALLELKPGYWRPYFDCNEIAYCYNLLENCLGGWVEGDFSCQVGHLGALCEQCDVYNTRGDGNFASSEKYYCGSCKDQSKNITIIALTILWTFFTLYFSVQSNLKMLEEFSKPQFTYQQKLTFQLNQPKTGVLMKMLTNYFQIIASLATFQLNFSVGIENMLNIAGNPIQTTAYSQDCFLKNLPSIDIQYARTIWLIIMPFLYFGAFLLFFLICSCLKLTQKLNQSIVITTILHMFIYFQPNMIGGLMQLLSFRKISGYQWVRANISTKFDSQLHFQWMYKFALPVLILLALIVPFFLYYSLFKNRNYLDKKRIRQNLGYLYHEYKPEAYFWEILKISQKEFIIIFLNFYEENIVVKGVLVLLTIYAYSFLNSKYKPFQSSSLNILDQASTNVCLVSFALAIGLYAAWSQNLYQLLIPFWIILAYYNIVFLIEIIYKIFIEYFKNYQQTIDYVIENLCEQFPIILKYAWAKSFIEKRYQSQSRIKQLTQKLQDYLRSHAKNNLFYKQKFLKIYKGSTNSNTENQNLGEIQTKSQQDKQNINEFMMNINLFKKCKEIHPYPELKEK